MTRNVRAEGKADEIGAAIAQHLRQAIGDNLRDMRRIVRLLRHRAFAQAGQVGGDHAALPGIALNLPHPMPP